MQFWSEPRRSCRLSSREKCLRQGRRSSEEGSKPRSRFARVDARWSGEMPRGCPSSCYGIGVEHPLQPPSMLGFAD